MVWTLVIPPYKYTVKLSVTILYISVVFSSLPLNHIPLHNVLSASICLRMRNSAAIHGKVAITRRRQLYDWISQVNYSGAGAAQAPSIEGNRGRPKVTMGLRMILTMDFVSPAALAAS